MHTIYTKIGFALMVLFVTVGIANAGTKGDMPKISVQLWSVKNAVKTDFKGTLKKLSDMGFQGVEFAGDFGPYEEDPAGLKQFLNSLGMQASGAHVGFELLTEETRNKTLAFYQKLGAKLLIVPWDERAWHPQGVKEVSQLLTQLTPIVAAAGMTLGFHNHDQEFNDYHGSTYWDYIAQQTPNSMLLQLDIGWVNYTGKDPVEYVKKYPGRTLTTHFKVRTHEGSGQNPILGLDGYNWRPLIKALQHYGGTHWIVVEQEEYPAGLTPMQSIQFSKQGLASILNAM